MSNKITDIKNIIIQPIELGYEIKNNRLISETLKCEGEICANKITILRESLIGKKFSFGFDRNFTVIKIDILRLKNKGKLAKFSLEAVNKKTKLSKK
jgi:hypothetical protein